MYFFVKHFLTLNCNKCSNNCDPQSWLSYCFQVVDLISLDLLMTPSRNIQNSGYHGRRYVGMSRTELLLHCNSKENEVNGALSSSQTSTHLKWVLWNLHPYQSIGVTWSKIISSACTDPIASLSGLWKCFSICVIQVTLIYFYFFPSYHIWLFRTATFRPRFLARGKASEEPTEGVVSKLWKITLKAYFFFKGKYISGWNRRGYLGRAGWLVPWKPAMETSTKCRCFCCCLKCLSGCAYLCGYAVSGVVRGVQPC